MIAADEVKSRILAAFPGALVQVTDLTGTQDHYQAEVVSEAFVGCSPLERHRLVYAALGEAMSGPIHALALKTYTPEAWARRSGGTANPGERAGGL
jgi:stress-induced morphogen